MSATNASAISPYEAYHGMLPEMRMLVFFQPGNMRANDDQKSQSQAVACYYPNSGHNHNFDCFKVLRGSICTTCYARDMTWVCAHT